MRALPLSLLLVLVLPLAVARASPAEVFQANCATCHGETGKADTKLGRKYGAADFTSVELQQRMTDEKIRDTIMNGKKGTKMKAWKGLLSQEDIDGLVLYVRALGRAGTTGAAGAKAAAQ